MIKQLFILLFSITSLGLYSQDISGFFDFNWNEETGKITLHIPQNKINQEFIYVNSLTAGVGSNDIGLDRGQLGTTRIVKFEKAGNKILLTAPNVKFRALSNNALEIKAVEEAFAKSVLFGFKIIKIDADIIHIDLTPFLLRDAHDIVKKLADKKQGTYKLDLTKSAIFKPNTVNFPKNSEFEAITTYVGSAKGPWIKSVSPNPDIVTVHQHHSFIELPDDDYQPRIFHTNSGFIKTSFYDYASPIGSDMVVRYINRHRLVKKDPHTKMSEAVDPIVYYLDSGCPEPVKSALLDGAKWWNQAFEAAGFKDAFQVKVLPADVHPLDIRYNVIQWVHRSTRGWSYGASVTNPRTGEIIKGHVSLGSLRVRQDFLIAQGILSNYTDINADPKMLEMALARLRQLSAHEVGHTIGLTHNFAASYNDRSSVMDYPHPLIEMIGNSMKFEKSYDDKIGDWDKRAIVYGYGSPSKNQTEEDFLSETIKNTADAGLVFISDQDARPKGGMHPIAHLWDNGKDPVIELQRLSTIRKSALQKMGSNSIPKGSPYSDIEKVLVPVYLMHRYQVEAVSKIIGGKEFSYAVKESGREEVIRDIPFTTQQKALNALLKTLDYEYLQIPESLIQKMPPLAYGYDKSRETFKGNTGSLFDPKSAAEASANHSFNFLLEPQRLSRIEQDKNWSCTKYLASIHSYLSKERNQEHKHMIEKLFFIHLLKLSQNGKTDKQVQASALFQIQEILNAPVSFNNDEARAHILFLQNLSAELAKTSDISKLPGIAKMPPGSPIGCH